MKKYEVNVKSKDGKESKSFCFPLDEEDVKGLDIDDLLGGTKGLVWVELAEEEDITIKQAQGKWYVEDISEAK